MVSFQSYLVSYMSESGPVNCYQISDAKQRNIQNHRESVSRMPLFYIILRRLFISISNIIIYIKNAGLRPWQGLSTKISIGKAGHLCILANQTQNQYVINT